MLRSLVAFDSLELPVVSGELVDKVAVIFAFSAIPFFLLLLRINAPYGRHARPGWGPPINPVVAWVLMESPASIIMAFWFIYGRGFESLMGLIPFLMWQAHYLDRAFIYPFRLFKSAPVPISIVIMGFLFNVINASLQGISLYGTAREALSFLDPRFLLGLLIFIFGFVLNRYSDRRLLALRREGKGYQVPRGGPFEYCSCPNYLGEIIEWLGFALSAWTLASLAFALWTFANLLPRALSHHRWYQMHFPDYPKGRKALIPFLL